MNRKGSSWLAATIVVGAASMITCGGGGNRPIPPRTTIKWIFDSYPDLGIAEGDSCLDLGVSRVQVALTGPDGAATIEMMDNQCSARQVSFEDLVPGTYSATVTPVDDNGESLLGQPLMVSVTATGADTEQIVNIPWDAWASAYTGTFYFRVTWGGMDCDVAAPAVATQVLTLTVGGTIAAQLTDSGQKLDGSDPEPCRLASDQLPQRANMVPFGPATFLIVGQDASGIEQYRQQFDTFVGAGPTNPELIFDLAGPDAMPADAMVDGGPDGGAPDGGVDATLQ
jgi:hypothetical protein